jgi:hypothetical protein
MNDLLPKEYRNRSPEFQHAYLTQTFRQDGFDEMADYLDACNPKAGTVPCGKSCRKPENCGKGSKSRTAGEKKAVNIASRASNYPKYGKTGNENVKSAARNVMFSAEDRLAKMSPADRKALQQKALGKNQRKSEGQALAKAKAEQKRVAAKAKNARDKTYKKAEPLLNKVEEKVKVSTPLTKKLFSNQINRVFSQATEKYKGTGDIEAANRIRDKARRQKEKKEVKALEARLRKQYK